MYKRMTALDSFQQKAPVILDIITYIILALYVYTVVVAIAALLLENRHPSKSIAWVLAIVMLPVIGLVIYSIFGRDSWRRFKIRRRRAQTHLSHTTATSDDGDPYGGVKTLLRNNSSYQAQAGNDVTLISDSRQIFDNMLSSVKEAQKYILAEFYIIDNDNIGAAFCDALTGKARQGISVLLLVDALGSMPLPKQRIRAMREAGVQVRLFMPIRFNWWGRLRRTTINYRDHRKQLIIDGTAGYLGGVNIADRYLTGNRLGVWRDNMLRICGPAVSDMQRNFISLWRFAGGADDSAPLPEFCQATPAGNTTVQIAPSAPLNDWESIAQGLQWVILNARRYVYLQSPYFAPPEKVLSAIHASALSGVDVRLMIPADTDTPMTAAAARTYIERLLLAGVRVLVYHKSFLHAKSLVADDSIVTIGSANLDERSANLNFELNAFVYDGQIARQARLNFEEDMLACDEIKIEEWGKRPRWNRLKESMARLFSPVL